MEVIQNIDSIVILNKDERKLLREMIYAICGFHVSMTADHRDLAKDLRRALNDE